LETGVPPLSLGLRTGSNTIIVGYEPYLCLCELTWSGVGKDNGESKIDIVRT
jgi:hypothetical protein